MRWTALLVFSTVLAASEIGGSSIRTVYVMPMTHGLDQYLANQITREHVFEVVADPKHADAVFTERLGEPLRYELEKLHPTPKPPEKSEAEDKADAEDKSEAEDKPEPADKKESGGPVKAAGGKDADSKASADKDTGGKDAGKKADSKDSAGKDAHPTDTDAKDTDKKGKRAEKKLVTESEAPRPFLSGRDKGTLFLVDAKSRTVLWSLYERPKRSSPNDLDRTAKRVVARLKQDLAGK